MICQFCKYEFPDSLGKYGCPNCEGSGLGLMLNPKGQRMDRTETMSEWKWQLAEFGMGHIPCGFESRAPHTFALTWALYAQIIYTCDHQGVV